LAAHGLYGDSLAHSALVEVALGFLLGVDLNLGVVAACVTLALLLTALQGQRRLPTDTLLGILAHSALSFGLVAVAFLDTVRVDLVGYLFGDILAIDATDLAWIYGGGAVALGVLAALWRPLLAATVHEELARAEGVPVTALRLALMLLVAVVIAVAMKVVGILLVTALLIVRRRRRERFARTPEQMAALASLAGCPPSPSASPGQLLRTQPAVHRGRGDGVFALVLALGALRRRGRRHPLRYGDTMLIRLRVKHCVLNAVSLKHPMMRAGFQTRPRALRRRFTASARPRCRGGNASASAWFGRPSCCRRPSAAAGPRRRRAARPRRPPPRRPTTARPEARG
jgi:zinc transport system permease protein